MLRSSSLAVLVLLVALPANAGADADIATVGARTPISAYGGHLAWSAIDERSGRFRLMHFRAGQVTAVRVPAGSRPFDVDLGPDGRGGVVAVYSRCERDPGGFPDPRPRDCDVYSVRLPDGRERPLRAVNTRGASELAASIRGSRVLFARWYTRRRGRSGHFAVLYTRRLSGRPRTARVPRGSIPGRRSCLGERYRRAPRTYGWPVASDLGRQAIAFEWQLVSSCNYGVGPVWEMRGLRPGARRATLIDTGLIGGTGGFFEPVSPNAVGRGVVYARPGGEFVTDQGPLWRYGLTTGRWLRADPPQDTVYLAVAVDAGATYVLRGPRLHDNNTDNAYATDPCRAPLRCILLRLDGVPFEPVTRRRPAPNHLFL